MAQDYIEGPPHARVKTTHKKTASAAKTTAASRRAADTAFPLVKRSSGSDGGEVTMTLFLEARSVRRPARASSAAFSRRAARLPATLETP